MHQSTFKEPAIIGTLLIQLPSKFAGCALVIEHSDEKKTLDFSSRSDFGFFASEFYADCKQELLPVY